MFHIKWMRGIIRNYFFNIHHLFTTSKGCSVNINHQKKGGSSKDPWKEKVFFLIANILMHAKPTC